MSLWNPTLGLSVLALFSARVSCALQSSRVANLQVPSSWTHAPLSWLRAKLMHACSDSTLESKVMFAPSCLLASSLHRASVT